MTKKQYKQADWQTQDQMFFDWLDQYLIDEGLESFESAGDYGHVDVVELRDQFEEELEAA